MEYKRVLGKTLNKVLGHQIRAYLDGFIFDAQEVYTVYIDGNIDDEFGDTLTHDFVPMDVYMDL